MSIDAIEFPKYSCHKQVWALKIKEVKIVDSDGRGILSFEDKRYQEVEVEPEYIEKHNPDAGGYYVIYEGGYKSFSPTGVFESGYTLA